jgi:hypothetical protein
MIISDLQEQVLHLALREKFITTEEILTELWGWPTWEQGYRKATVGEGVYNAKHASLSRSLARLSANNLVKLWKSLTLPGTGITLTGDGEWLIRAILDEGENA